ncbi:hypothetical protein FRX31_025498, partial [Thalictrum thalictroides]
MAVLTSLLRCSFSTPQLQSSQFQRWNTWIVGMKIGRAFSLTNTTQFQIRRRTLIYAVSQDAEKSFKKTVEVDKLIDMLRDSNPTE